MERIVERSENSIIFYNFVNIPNINLLNISSLELDDIRKKIVNDDGDFCLCEMKMNDIGFPDFVSEETQYTAFPGDVTSFTDDAIAFMFDEVYWTDSYETVKIAAS